MDEAGFTDYVRERQPALRRYAFLLCGDWQRAEDAVQSALVKVWSRLRRPGDVTALDAYVRRAVLNECLQAARRRSASERPVADVAESAVVTHDEVAESDALWQVVRDLPDRQRAVLVLRYHEDLDDVRIADLLGCSVGSVKTHGARGLARLRAGSLEEA